MNALIQSQNTNIQKPFQTEVTLNPEDFYYIKQRFLNINLTDTDCARIRADPKYSLDGCDKIMNDITSSASDVATAYQRALCDNKAAAIKLKVIQSQLHSSTQGLDDTTEYYNIMFIQTVNLALGILTLASASIYTFMKTNSPE